ncbi:MAG: tetratricopeptide repeat protein [Oligoflexus sp.]
MGVIQGRLALTLSPKTTSREKLRKALAAGNYQVSFISNISEVKPAIDAFKPVILLHDWLAVDESQSRKFHYQALRNEVFHSLPRVILVPDVSANMLAFANDVMAERVMSYSSAYLTLGNELEMLLQSQRTGREIKKLVREVRSEEAKYDQDEIDEKVNQAYQRYPHDLNVQLEYGNLKLRQDELEIAKIMAIEVIRRNPLNLRASNLLSRVYMKQGFWAKALEILQQADSLSPMNGERLMIIGDAYYGKGDLDQALSYYEKAKAVDESMAAKANRGIGQIKLQQGHLEDALALLGQSASEEEAAGYFNNAAVIAVKQGELDQALKLYDTALRALQTNRLKPTIYNNIALTFRRLGQTQEAEKYLQKVLKIDSENPKARQQIKMIAKVRKS